MIERLNAERHRTALNLFMLVVLGHWGEHIAQAYQIWADALKPILRTLLGPPAAADLAPPPTGDPGARR